MKILDCTLRDGGYYTNWDFDREHVKTYLKSFNSLPVDYLEVGYRNPQLKDYNGEYYYCPPQTLRFLKKHSNKKLAIILNEKDISIDMVDMLLDPCQGIIDMVRMAIDPVNFLRAIELAQEVKAKGFEVAFNVMYMSTWDNHPEMMDKLQCLDGTVDYFYLVDSFGGVFPEDVKSTLQKVRARTNVKIGFHGHNNLEMALANTLVAIEEGVDIVDATITGMGRGAGNLKTELLLTVLNQKNNIEVDFNPLSEVTAVFQDLQDEYKWGTSLPYMVSGASSLPQKQVMEWVSKRYYSINSIIRALSNQSKKQKDNDKFSSFEPETYFKSVVIIGGGPSAIKHKEAMLSFLDRNVSDICVIHASSKNATAYKDIKNQQFFCLVGNEGARLEKVFSDLEDFHGQCILPPYPRKMGTYVPDVVRKKTFELAEVDFTGIVNDSHTAIAIQGALQLGAETIYLTGYDGYTGSTIARKDQELFTENSQLFDDVAKKAQCLSLTPTKYKNIIRSTIYQYID